LGKHERWHIRRAPSDEDRNFACGIERQMRLVPLFPPAEIDMTDLVWKAGFAEPDRRTKTVACFCSVQF
jgi:hypothetical protein